MTRKKHLLAWAGAASLALAITACGSSDDNGGSSGGGGATGAPWILGTTDVVTSLDPAGSYDTASWNLQYNLFQQLVSIPANGTKPEPDAAKSCDYTDPKTVKCVLQPNLKFSNGDALTSSDVKFTFERNIAINDPNGSAVLLGSITDSSDPDHPKLKAGAIETPDDTTVIFHLNQPDLTFIKVLTTATASIVDEDVFPADKKLADDQVIGSGPYKLSQYKPKEQAVFEANPEYTGPHPGKSKQIIVQFFNDPSPMKQAISSGQIDVAWRTFTPTDLNSLSSSGDVSVLTGQGSEFRYWVWDMKKGIGKQAAVRKAVAQLIDRDAIAKNAYDGTVTPAYSIVPPGFSGQKDSFKEVYGEPSVSKAKQILQQAGIKTPISITLGYPPEHYGTNAVDEANEVADELKSSGLFTVKVQSAEWTQYQTLYKQDAYDLFLLGWYPDFLDADNYLTPFVRDGGFFDNGYHSDAVNKLLDQELGETDEAKRNDEIGQLQDIVAKDVPLIPSWDGKNVAVATSAMSGVKDTLDPTYIFRFWMISKNG